MKIVKVIHGYPPHYNAGSEVYSQLLCHALADKGHEVQVFTREENPFKQDYCLTQELSSLDPRLLLNKINIPKERNRYRYSIPEVDEQFKKLLDRFQPDVVHIGHLNHLSLTLLEETSNVGVPVVYTLHDYWLMCPRGQFLQRNSKKEVWALCDGQEDRKCAETCYRGYFSGLNAPQEQESNFWTDWIHTRMSLVRSLMPKVDVFIAPSRFLRDRYMSEFTLSKDQIRYLDYGFDHSYLQGRQRQRTSDSAFTFGYIGTHIPAKGIQHLIEAFGGLSENSRLMIWGRERLENTNPLKESVARLPEKTQQRIFWRPEYRNDKIVKDVFNHVDAIVVPSIWYENSPLVIHEAQQVGIPIITADSGGMAEYVHHEKNGLLFRHRDPASLSEQMQRFVDNPGWASSLAKNRYLFSETGDVPSIEDQAKQLTRLYEGLVSRRVHNHTQSKITSKPGPWRITFDTNPEDCNMRCIMCEGFSPYSNAKDERLQEKRPRRRMDIALIRKVLEDARGTPLREIIPSTMGEPLVYRHFDDIITMCHEFNLKLNLTTNGTFPIKGAAGWARLIAPVASDVKISWNGATKETQEKIMLGSNWEKVLGNLKEFIAVRDEITAQGGNRCRVTLQLTFLQTNVHELADVVRLGISLGVDRIKGHHLWTHFNEIKDLSMRRDQTAIQEWNEKAREAMDVANKNLLPNGKKIVLENIFPLSQSAEKDLVPGGECPFLGKEAWINTEGKFSPCCAPDKQRATLGDFGAVTTQSLETIWKSETYQELRKTYPQKNLCLGCNMRRPLLTES